MPPAGHARFTNYKRRIRTCQPHRIPRITGRVEHRNMLSRDPGEGGRFSPEIRVFCTDPMVIYRSNLTLTT
jgi:hypothetical protein